jgi:hypothetical protein
VAVVGILTLVGYLVTPQPMGAKGAPSLFVYDVRFVALSVLLGLLSLPLIVPMNTVVRGVHLIVFGTILTVTQFAPGIWSDRSWTSGRPSVSISPPPFGAAIALGAVIVIFGTGYVLTRRLSAWGAAGSFRLAGLVGGALVLALSFPVQHDYVAHRYKEVGPQPITDRWIRQIHHQRIGLANLILQYPFYGVDDTNFVQFLGDRQAHGGFAAPDTCSSWRRAVNAGHYSYVISMEDISRHPLPPSPTEWTRSDRAAHARFREVTLTLTGEQIVWVFAIHGSLDPKGCTV